MGDPLHAMNEALDERVLEDRLQLPLNGSVKSRRMFPINAWLLNESFR